MKAKLTKEEKEILDSFEKGEWVPVADLSQRRKSWSSINHLSQHFLHFFPLPQGHITRCVRFARLLLHHAGAPCVRISFSVSFFPFRA